MSFIINTKNRSPKIELMDDFSTSGKLLHDTLDEIASINKWLGGNRVTLQALKKIIKNNPKYEPLTIIDLGCGNGDMLRKVAHYGKKQGYDFKLVGIDANESTVNYAKKLSRDYPEISYLHQDIFSDTFKDLTYDVVLSTLFLHHFGESKILELLSLVLEKARIGIIVNDLNRHPVAYYLFKLLGVIIKSPMAKNDGLISILRGFRRRELEQMAQLLKVQSDIAWKWAFRYQWIMIKDDYKTI